MDKFTSIPAHYIPAAGTQMRLLLEILIDGASKMTLELTILLGANPRSALQSLTKKYHWLIHNEGGSQGSYRLDPRHLSGVSKLDDEARVEAQLNYLDRSLIQSKREMARLPNAETNLALARHQANQNQIELALETK
mgnify:CR=1 FL=1